MEYNEGDIVLCTVVDVGDAVTSVVLNDGTKGTIVSSEIASGRIKYMRSYVVPNKKIVCKVLSNNGKSLNLSLRRVSLKEKQEIMKGYKQKMSIKSAFKQILGKDYDSIRKKILEDYKDLLNFMDDIHKLEGDTLSKYIPEKYIESVKKINDKREKEAEVRFSVVVSCIEKDGIVRIKKVFENEDENLKIIYASAGKFILKYVADDFKKAKQNMNSIIETMKERARMNNCEFEFREDKK